MISVQRALKEVYFDVFVTIVIIILSFSDKLGIIETVPDPVRGVDVTKLKEKEPPIIWLTGSPSCGKTTQALKTAAHYGWEVISVDDLVTTLSSSDFEQNYIIRQHLADKTHIPSEIILDLIYQKMLQTIETTKTYLIEGFPRDRIEGKMFESEVYPSTLVLYMGCSEEGSLEKAEAGGGKETENISKKWHAFENRAEFILSNFQKKTRVIDGDLEEPMVFRLIQKAVDSCCKGRC